MTAARRLPRRRVRPGQQPGSSLSPSGIDGPHRRRVKAQPVSRRTPRSLPASAAQTRAEHVPFQRRRDVPVQVPLRYWLVGGSAVAVFVPVSGFGPFSLPLSWSWGSLVTSASTGPGGARVGGATVVV